MSGVCRFCLHTGDDDIVKSFTINTIELKALPSSMLQNGDNLRLECLVDIAKTTDFKLNSTFKFLKDDNLIYNVTTTNAQAIYTIHNASVSRSGLYKCQIITNQRHKTSAEIKVKVTGLSAPVITVSQREVSEGDEITVRCEAPNEEPPMYFNFYKTDKERGAAKVKQSNKNNAETTYEIKEGESILHFECSIRMMIQDEPESPSSRREMVTVVEPFGTPTIRVHPSNNFTEGQDMQVTCTVQMSHISSKEVTITLQKGNQILKSSTSEQLFFSRVATVGDMGNYTCKAEGTAASKTTSAMIKVKELFPKPRLTLKPSRKTQYINDGDLVVLECSVPSLPHQEAIKQDFYLLVNDKGRRNMARGGRLQMHLRAADSGDYKCEVTIANITKTSEQVQVKVYAAVSKPELKQIVKENKMVVLGDTLTLTCRSPTGTPPIMYALYREGEQLGRKEMNDNREAVFEVNTTKRHDLGQYQCHASNRNNRSNASSDVLNITVITPVREVRLTIIPQNGEVEEGAELSLVCKAKHGTLPITFNFYANGNLLETVTKTDGKHAEHTVSSFTKQKDGAYSCAASNQANKSVGSEFMEVKAVLARWKKAVIGTFVFLIIMAAIGIALYLYLDKKKKGKNILSESSRSSKGVNSSSEKPAVDVKTDDSYFDDMEIAWIGGAEDRAGPAADASENCPLRPSLPWTFQEPRYSSPKAVIAGSVQNEEEMHILKTAEENIGNNQQNHEVEYTEADSPAPDPNHDSVENNFSENSNVNNLT
ncbi:PREDICTED: platelet endothelial cell adhesion molecule [Nanorana parkeri]|uniref:platelet endothelial cell adhesion molecule n=1 Tax=Nanorana parkeri TaxID=125878 RepID=UPI0008541648|nr:PREDICTED: platelet endothelial cell adhesion molecule [Nanorana parkeri]